jgi:hypothetical protein
MPWISFANAMLLALSPPSATKPAPREPDPLADALAMQASLCAQAAVIHPDPKEAAQFLGQSIKAQWDLVEHNLRKTLEAYEPHTRRNPCHSENHSASGCATPSASS